MKALATAWLPMVARGYRISVQSNHQHLQATAARDGIASRFGETIYALEPGCSPSLADRLAGGRRVDHRQAATAELRRGHLPDTVRHHRLRVHSLKRSAACMASSAAWMASRSRAIAPPIGHDREIARPAIRAAKPASATDFRNGVSSGSPDRSECSPYSAVKLPHSAKYDRGSPMRAIADRPRVTAPISVRSL